MLQDLHVEVHEKTYAHARQAEVSDDLCNVNRMDPLNRFDLEDEPIRNKEVYAMVAQYLVAISDWQGSFSFERNADGVQLDAACERVHIFAQPWAQSLVHFETASDGLFGKPLEFIR